MPIIFVRETDPQHGGVPWDVHKRHCPAEHDLDTVGSARVPWYRQRALQNVSLQQILEPLLQLGAATTVRSGADGDAETRRTYLPDQRMRRPLRFEGGGVRVYASAHNVPAPHVQPPGQTPKESPATRLVDELCALMPHDVQRAPDLASANCFVLHLTDSTFVSNPVLVDEVERALHRRMRTAEAIYGTGGEAVRIVTVHELRDGLPGANAPFSSIIESTPAQLKGEGLGLYARLAVPLHSGEHGNVSRRMLLKDLGASEARTGRCEYCVGLLQLWAKCRSWVAVRGRTAVRDDEAHSTQMLRMPAPASARL